MYITFEEKFAEIEDMINSLTNRIKNLEDSSRVVINLEKNNLDRMQQSLYLASKIFGDTVSIEQALQEINKLQKIGITSIEEK